MGWDWDPECRPLIICRISNPDQMGRENNVATFRHKGRSEIEDDIKDKNRLDEHVKTAVDVGDRRRDRFGHT